MTQRRSFLFAAGICLCVFLKADGLAAGEDPPPVTKSKAVEIHLPPGDRETQLDELIRQLGIRAFVDVGRGWKVPATPEEEGRLAWPAFSFKSGDAGEALDAFCKARPDYHWRLWKEVNAIWVEPRLPEHRAAAFYLQRPFKRAPELRRDDEIGGWMLTCNLNEIWEETRLAGEKRHSFVIGGEGRLGPEPFVFTEQIELKDTFALVRWWLTRGPDRVSALGISDQPENKDGPTRVVRAFLGRLRESLASRGTEEIVEGLWSETSPPGYEYRISRELACMRELYRRYRFQPQAVMEALRNKRYVENAYPGWRASVSSGQVLEMLRWDLEAFGNFFIQEFEAGSQELKLRMLENQLLPYSDDWGGKFLEFWEKLSRSDVPELRQAGLLTVESTRKRLEETREPQP